MSSVLFLSPASASAGVLSFVNGFFSGKQTKAEKSTQNNSQNMPILQASVSPDPNFARGGGDITVVGDSALLPDSGSIGTWVDVLDNPDNNNNGQISRYVVHEDDSLGTIAKMYGVSVNTIRWANNLTTSTVIKPGQVLIILPMDSIQHTVAGGETLEGIVKKYGGDINETLAFNGWSSGYKPEVGTIVIIPNGEGEPLINSGTAVRRGGGLFENYYGDYYLRPIMSGYYISQGFHGYKNSGIDMAAALGTPIFAVDDGYTTVSRCGGWNGGYGCYVVIEHSNKKTQALYAHMNQSIVSAGQYVVRGQVIGYVGSTGRSTGPHLHFELRK